MTEKLRILYLEDIPEDAELSIASLEEAGYECEWERVERSEDFLDRLAASEYDLVLSDFQLPTFDGLSALKLFLELDLQIPFVLVSGTIGEETAVDSLRAGAADFVIKNKLFRLPAVVSRVLKEKEENRKIKLAEERIGFQAAELLIMNERFDLATRAAGLGIWDWNLLKGELTWDDRIYKLYGIGPADFGGAYDAWVNGLHPDDRVRCDEEMQEALRGEREFDTQFRVNWPDGSIRYLKALAHIERDPSGKPVRMTGVNFDMTEQAESAERVRGSEERYRDLVENAHDIIYSHDLEGSYTSINAAAEQITGYTREESLNMNLADIVVPEQLDKAREMIARKLKGEKVTAYELGILAKDGRIVTVEVNTKLVSQDGVPVGIQGIARDVTERKSLQKQLAQSQKLESLGRLTGGIAHDFNNMLTAINGYSDLSLRQIAADDPVRRNIEEIKKAGELAAMLANQLLAFSRSQILQPEVIVISDIINDTSNMLKRVIGEDIELVTILKDTVGRTKVDPGQLSQIVMNLAVNARDAMPNGGKLTIETANAILDSNYARQHVGVLPGPYVVLSVSDTGTGMTAAMQEKIFEPFFTTKEVGKGTGLGLATVYGIVKQSGGGIFVYSEVGHGTTFKIYLPRVVEKLDIGEVGADLKTEFAMGSETILLVEDEDLVRSLSHQVLETCGYTVIDARDGVEALEIMGKEEIHIDLLFSDVVMPRMGGRELAEKLLATIPDLPILFASGYTDDAIVRHGELETNINFIQKPYSLDDLARKVRNLLDSKK